VAVPAVAAFGLVIVQALLGAIVVWSELEAVNVTLHLATAMLLVASLVLATVGAFTLDVATTGRDRLQTQAWGTAGTVYALLVVGALVRGEGAGLAFKDWPLMDGTILPSLGRVGPAVQFLHRSLALVAGVLVVWLALRARARRAERPATARWASIAAGLFAAQVLLGAGNVWTGLATWAVVGHVLLASLVWGALVATAALAGVEAARSTVPGGGGAAARGIRALGGDGAGPTPPGDDALPASVTAAQERR
jgi:cytochrome c oxidase assembly protein subunit 15